MRGNRRYVGNAIKLVFAMCMILIVVNYSTFGVKKDFEVDSIDNSWANVNDVDVDKSVDDIEVYQNDATTVEIIKDKGVDDIEASHDDATNTEIIKETEGKKESTPCDETDLDPLEKESKGNCVDWTSTKRIVERWLEKVSTDEDRHLERYTLENYEYNPVIERFKNVCSTGILGDIRICTPEDMASITKFQSTVIRIGRFDIFNVYEMHHSLLNTYLILRMFELTPEDKAVFVFTDSKGKNSVNHDMYQALTPQGDLIYGDTLDKTIVYHYDEIIVSPSSGTSLLVTKNSQGGPLLGRGRDHHCRSTCVRDYSDFVAKSFAPTTKGSNQRLRTNNDRKKRKIIWSSRAPHERESKTYIPHRMIENEAGLLNEIQDRLGSDYEIKAVEFGLVSAKESVSLAHNADMFVGVHGAGLTWIMFLPRHGGLVEIFGGDRSSANRHYHNIASFSDLHYRQYTLSGYGRTLRWTSRDADKIAQVIKSIPCESKAYEPTD